MNTEPSLYGLLAEFTDPVALVAATQAAQDEGYRRIEAYTPFPIEELAEIIGFTKTRVPLVVLIGGIVGCVGGFFMQYYACVISYPLNVGGRPIDSWPAFVPITFELTILCAALAAVFGMLGLNRLPMPYHPLFHVPEFARASQDRFFLCIETSDPKFELESAREFLASVGAREVKEVPQ
ncbi:MAG TPA: DUF3341 domain-containing protein [Pirellulales bacterium]|jgi:hypothetical protein|nr:DUF3341 domain-containing protein [Pirellulales bacterium]